MRLLLLILTLGVAAGCSLEPRPLDYAGDRCTHCMMPLSDPRFGAELVTPQGKKLPFDAVECMVDYVAENQPEIHSMWVVDFAAPETLLPIDQVVLYQSPALPSPMGRNLGAFADGPSASRLAPGGDVVTWSRLLRDAGRTETPHPSTGIHPH